MLFKSSCNPAAIAEGKKLFAGTVLNAIVSELNEISD